LRSITLCETYRSRLLTADSPLFELSKMALDRLELLTPHRYESVVEYLDWSEAAQDAGLGVQESSEVVLHIHVEYLLTACSL
jgi:hypothetical protein